MLDIVDDPALQARLRPGALAVFEFATGRRWNYAEWDLAIARTVRVLSGRYGIGPGERVAHLGHNCAEHVLLHLACARLGAIFVPLNWRLAVAKLARLLDDCEPALLVGDRECLSAGIFRPRAVDVAVLRREVEAATPLASAPFDPSRPSLILYTSGTSGRPKGVLLSERNIAQTAVNFSVVAQVTHTSVVLADAPMFHVIGIVANVRPVFMRGGAVLVSARFEPATTLARLADPRLRVTHWFCVPQVAQMLRDAAGFDPEKLRGLTGIFSGGAPNPAAHVRRWLEDGVPIADGLGMSETGTISCMPLELALIDRKAGSVGLVPPGMRLRIVDADGRDVPPGGAGELWLKGRNVFSAYWRAPAETAKAFNGDGWFRTGDIVSQDEEGFLYVVDRRKDMFISGGENVYPAEVEAVLTELAGIREAAVVGVPDARWGEVGHLAVVVAHDGPGAATIQAFIEARLARYKVPKYVSFVEALPRTGSGKIQKTRLREQIRAEQPLDRSAGPDDRPVRR
ncbi:MAG: AMP-binding protein [Rhodanobacteraceae bacterium]